MNWQLRQFIQDRFLDIVLVLSAILVIWGFQQ